MNIKVQNTTNFPVFNTIYIRKESINNKFKHTFKYGIIFSGKIEFSRH